MRVKGDKIAYIFSVMHIYDSIYPIYARYWYMLFTIDVEHAAIMLGLKNVLELFLKYPIVAHIRDYIAVIQFIFRLDGKLPAFHFKSSRDHVDYPNLTLRPIYRRSLLRFRVYPKISHCLDAPMRGCVLGIFRAIFNAPV